ncbi:MarR family winged helix-turn-helix transcriptional regulator [Georgenia thermotolerans]|uniref:MarR family transcriptional regulator n=1 Tax=Georgenia thermotolerans TaxID=527326 RepID=A0A7J5UT04_9MICO|nr:MarR family transcriptional regulator [Georgenia thermotolerans]KAE8765420.1 MarR family transcriptional regulator [Georgenia thermotolerans]
MEKVTTLLGPAAVDEAPRPGDADEQLHSAFLALLRWTSRSAVRTRLWTGDGVELTPTDAWLIDALAAHGPMRVTTLAGWQGVDKSTVTPQVRRLERAGLVDRRPDPEDGRASLLTLSAHGREVRERVRAAGGQALSRSLASWDDADRRALAELLIRFVATVEQAEGDEAAGHGADRRPTEPGETGRG